MFIVYLSGILTGIIGTLLVIRNNKAKAIDIINKQDK